MNFVADESVDQPIVERLRAEGHDIWAVVEEERSISDDRVLEVTNQQRRVLITGDKDFGDMVFRDRRFTLGVVLVRLAGLSAALKAQIVATAVREHAQELPENFTVVAPNSIRIRRRFP
jgi:predicted nuclease of predicted toxin-antitoxin system